MIEERATQTYSLQEQRYEQAARIRTLKQRHAIVKLPDADAVSFTTATIVEQVASPDRIRAFNRRMLDASPYTRPIADIEHEVITRTRALDLRVAQNTNADEPPTFGEPATLPARRRVAAG